MGTMGGGTNLNMVMKKESQSLNEAVSTEVQLVLL